MSVSSSSSTSPTLSELQTQFHDTQSSFANHIKKVRTLEGVIAKHDAIKCEVGLLMWLGKSTAIRDGEHEEGCFGVGGGGREDDDDQRSTYTTLAHSRRWPSPPEPTSPFGKYLLYSTQPDNETASNDELAPRRPSSTTTSLSLLIYLQQEETGKSSSARIDKGAAFHLWCRYGWEM
jgi:hypothetical protein